MDIHRVRVPGRNNNFKTIGGNIMVIDTTTSMFKFVNIRFYESLASPEKLFEENYDEMPEYIEEEGFEMTEYRCSFIPSIQNWADYIVSSGLGAYGIRSIEVNNIKSPGEYNFATDWAEISVGVDDDWRRIAVSRLGSLKEDKDCDMYFNSNFKTVSGFIFYGPETWDDFGEALANEDTEYDTNVLFGMYSTLAFVKEFGDMADEEWDFITEDMMGCLRYEEFAMLRLLIPEDSEYLFKDVYTAEADEIYHNVLDKYGWAWRNPKYESKTELCTMLKWAKDKGMTIEDLKNIGG